jgi:hypothetical protein
VKNFRALGTLGKEEFEVILKLVLKGKIENCIAPATS